MKEKNVLKMLSEIVSDIDNQDLETVSELLNHYNRGPVIIDGESYPTYNDPVVAAKLNARYKALTGKDHPRFLEEKDKVIATLMEDKEMLIESGAYTEEYFEKLEEIKNIKAEPSEEEFQKVNTYAENDFSIVGEEKSEVEPEPVVEETPEVKTPAEDDISIVEETKADIEPEPIIGEVPGKSTHILNKLHIISGDLENANKEELGELLNYYNGEPVEIDGTMHHTYNDPVLGSKLNNRYKELTGEDHPRFLQEKDKVIDGLMEDKEMLIEEGAYTQEYFDRLEEIRNIKAELVVEETSEVNKLVEDDISIVGEEKAELASETVEEKTVETIEPLKNDMDFKIGNQIDNDEPIISQSVSEPIVETSKEENEFIADLQKQTYTKDEITQRDVEDINQPHIEQPVKQTSIDEVSI